jgi:UDP-N-acetylmuramate--alanine ligase
VIIYGLDRSAAHITGEDMRLEAFGSTCDVLRHQGEGASTKLGRLRLRVPGRHNLLNALGAVAVGLEAGVPFERIAAALEEFRGADRRFQMRGEERGVMVVDDYGHHPTEIAAVIAAARAGIDRRVVVVFQPHRYSRTASCCRVRHRARAAGEVVLTDIYAAGEDRFRA